MLTTRTFDKTAAALALGPRYIDSEGGMRSGKTYTNLQLLSLICPADKYPTVTSVVSECLPHLKRGAIQDFKSIMLADGRWDENAWSKSEYIYTFPNGSTLEFFGVDQAAKVHGPARHRLFINEAQNVQWETARQLIARTSDLVIWDYNPTHRFWAHEEFENDPKCAHIHSTYLDNNLIPAAIREFIERNKKDPYFWRVYGQGLVGILEGLIYQDFTQVDTMPPADAFKETYGLDFGYTNDPTALVRCLIHTGRKEIWLDEIVYERGLQPSDIAKILKEQGLTAQSGPAVYADSSQPATIDNLNSYGLNVIKCDKRAKIKEQIGFIHGFDLYVTKRSVHLIKELRNYMWMKNNAGDFINEPRDLWNHACDAFRYGIYTPFSQFGSGQYAVSIQ